MPTFRVVLKNVNPETSIGTINFRQTVKGRATFLNLKIRIQERYRNPTTGRVRKNEKLIINAITRSTG